MKKIINGKMYNTGTAKPIYLYTNGLPESDFNSCKEFLYRKTTGEYFLHGWGGAMSKYSEQCGSNTWSGGEEITPLTEEEAKLWTELHADADTYIEEFGEVGE